MGLLLFFYTGTGAPTTVYGEASGTLGFSGSAAGVARTKATGAASGTFGIDGSAAGRSFTVGFSGSRVFGITGYASGRVRGALVTGSADGSYGFTGRVRGRTGSALPATEWDWATPDVDPEVLRTLRVKLATRDGEYTVIDPAELTDLRIELTRKGGVESISMTLARDARREVGDLDFGTRLTIDYMGRRFDAWLLEASLTHDSGAMTRPVMFVGEVARLEQEHEAFRRVYVDSRLSAWKTDQGPSTASHVFEVSA